MYVCMLSTPCTRILKICLLEVSSPTLPKIRLYSKVLSLGGSWQLLYIKANQLHVKHHQERGTSPEVCLRRAVLAHGVSAAVNW
jgi:hypothetical protein